MPQAIRRRARSTSPQSFDGTISGQRNINTAITLKPCSTKLFLVQCNRAFEKKTLIFKRPRYKAHRILAAVNSGGYFCLLE